MRVTVAATAPVAPAGACTALSTPPDTSATGLFYPSGYKLSSLASATRRRWDRSCSLAQPSADRRAEDSLATPIRADARGRHPPPSRRLHTRHRGRPLLWSLRPTAPRRGELRRGPRSEEHTSEL